MSRIFGGRDPFDDPFFSRPFGSLFGSRKPDPTQPSGESLRVDKLKGPFIEELDSDDENLSGNKEDDVGVGGEKKDKSNQDASTYANPLVQHPEDQTDDHGKIESKSSDKDLYFKPLSADRGISGGERPQKVGVSFRRITYGGINGDYYTASATRRTGEDGVVLEESKEADIPTGRATHSISKGIHEKGHSVVRKLSSDGKVDTVQTLHNLEEDELASFDRSWKGNADSHMPGWDHGYDFPSMTGAGGSSLTSWNGWELPFRSRFDRNLGFAPGSDGRAPSNERRPKNVVTIPIE